MKVSIIIPVYNVSAYIERCITSVMHQTYGDIECIIVDDHTPDDSMEKCQKLIDSYCGPIKFKILHHEHNRGLSAARNTGLNATQGEYIYYLDSDDYLTKDCLELLVTETEKHPGSDMICGAAEPNDKVYVTKTYVRLTDNKQIRIQRLSPHLGFPIPAWNKLIKRDFIFRHHLFFREGIIHEDVLWTFHVIQHLSSVSMLPLTTYHYFQREQSIMYSTSKAKRANSMMTIVKEMALTADNPYRLLFVIDSLIRAYEWFRYSSTSNRQCVLALFNALCTENRKKMAILYCGFLLLCPQQHGLRLGRYLQNKLRTIYVKEVKQI